MTNLKIGDRCIITYSHTGLDDGAIVVVSGYMVGNLWAGYLWESDCDVIVTPLGRNLHSINEFINMVQEERERPWPSKFLRKMPEVDIDEELYDEVPA